MPVVKAVGVDIKVTGAADAKVKIGEVDVVARQLKAVNPVEIGFKIDSAKAMLQARLLRAGIQAELSRGLGAAGGGGGGLLGTLFGNLGGAGATTAAGAGPLATALTAVGPAGLGIGAAVAAPIAAAVAGTVAQAIGGAVVFGLGAALTGIAIKGATQFQPVKKVFTNLANDANTALMQIGVPFRHVMESIFTTADSVVKSLAPVFQTASRTIAGPFQAFATTFLNAFKQPAVAASIQAVAKAFGSILTSITPQLPGDIAQIARAIGEMAAAISQNPQIFATFLRVMTNLATWAIQGLAQLIRAGNWFDRNWPGIWSGAALVVLQFVQNLLDGLHTAGDAVFTFTGGTVHLMRTLLDAVGIHTLDGIDNGLSRAKGSFDRFFNHADALINGWRVTLLNAPKKVKLEGDISQLQGKIAAARALLSDPTLTKTRRAAIEANIDQFQRERNKVLAELAALNGATATTFITSVSSVGGRGPGHPLVAPGTPTRAAGGWASGLTLVGERGPELLSVPAGSYVYNNSQTRGMLGGSTYNIHVSALVADKNAGRLVVEAIRKFEQGSGHGWRK